MKILLDNNVPAYLQGHFGDHEVSTAFKMGWQTLSNGKLLSAAEVNGFDLLVTLDFGFSFEQNLKGRSIAVAILCPLNQSRGAFSDVARALVERIDEIGPASLVVFRVD